MGSFGDWFRGLRGRLLLMIAIPMVALLVLGGVSLHGVKEQTDDLNVMTKVRLPVTGLTGELRTDTHAMARYLWVAINTDSPKVVDESLEVHRAYGTWGEKNSYGRIVTGTLRSTFVIDESGVISATFYNTKAKHHVAMLRKRLGLAA